MCAGASCPISLRALGRRRTLPRGSCAPCLTIVFFLGCALLVSHSALRLQHCLQNVQNYFPLLSIVPVKENKKVPFCGFLCCASFCWFCVSPKRPHGRTHVLAHGRQKGREPHVGQQPRKSLKSPCREKVSKSIIDSCMNFLSS